MSIMKKNQTSKSFMDLHVKVLIGMIEEIFASDFAGRIQGRFIAEGDMVGRGNSGIRPSRTPFIGKSVGS